ncbi:hypothetical protein Terro_3845 [Terriglobus roseus DSM 18391]|uniref:Uncharacterized protein n=1 Tax=Terriglobus roseus (strain DSM 18391 / NRRL B-41598 / KBS 63) TaxID=926566 RepID=I3ZLD6_TERRK|nr:hypothetical protein [Terriglobus roseus]AFL90054.1 hypothetical protein Terro_3845 [Terriglobus roseus DSM 18391]
MQERTIEFEEPVIQDESQQALQVATERAERAEAELAKLKSAQQHTSHTVAEMDLKQPPSPSTAQSAAPVATETDRGSADEGGEAELRKDPMMATLLDALDGGNDVGHYGRLVFAMVARHFLPHDEVLAWLTKDADFSDTQARAMLQQVEGRDYTPPKRERLIQWQAEQEFQFIDANDPDSGNLYRNLKFPSEIYEHIEHYQEAKA